MEINIALKLLFVLILQAWNKIFLHKRWICFKYNMYKPSSILVY